MLPPSSWANQRIQDNLFGQPRIKELKAMYPRAMCPSHPVRQPGPADDPNDPVRLLPMSLFRRS